MTSLFLPTCIAAWCTRSVHDIRISYISMKITMITSLFKYDYRVHCESHVIKFLREL